MNTERTNVMLALAAFCALGALSALVPAIAVTLLVLLGVGVLAGIGAVIRAWWRTRPEPLPTDHPHAHQAASTVTLREVA